ncbi:UDP-glycosyltransferase 92A1-like [Cornus florida]|uniref:UDP-glycosyltransferase 92A1-like n=1 Tax=Cornus florida TaxID=4283 RepID=UPI00289F76B9|nr:UDP-glycosyltransferase 92A1-like [Cornus florida]
MAKRKENVVVFPFMAQGHMIPFLALALQIEQRGYNITFINTPLNIKKLQFSLPPNTSIRLLEIPFNSADHSLPPGIENTDVLPYTDIITLFEASLSLKPAFRKLLLDLTAEDSGAPPLCVIADIFFGWTADVTRELGIFSAIFSGAGGFGLACYYSIWLGLPHRNTNSLEFSLPDFPEAGEIHVTQLAPSMVVADGTDRWSVFELKTLPAWLNADGILFNTVEALDRIGLAYFNRKIGRPVWAIGPILLSVDNRARTGREFGIKLDQCIEWLNAKPPSSVLYVSFGSQNTISASQMMNLARALEASEKSFIWVVRPPLGFDINSKFEAEKWLPEGFVERVEDRKRGLIVVNWAPQVEILSHKSVAAFLTHCGWNSVLEALSRGVPLMGWPMQAEQFFNSKFLEEEVGVCVEVARGTGFEVRHEDLVKKIELVMSEEGRKGKEMRRKACEVKEMIRDATRDEEGFKGSSVKAMGEFLDAALLMKEKTKCEHND